MRCTFSFEKNVCACFATGNRTRFASHCSHVSSRLTQAGLDLIESVLNLDVEELISGMVSDLGEAIDDMFQDITEFVPDLAASFTIPEPLIQFPLLLRPGRDFSFSLFVNSITGDPEYLGTRFAGSLEGRLTEPDWRAGMSYSPQIDDRIMPQAEPGHRLGELAQFNIMFGCK
jgi:hypothetical protein